LRYEKIARFEGIRWEWPADPLHHRSARRIADGKKDGRKQDALYVRIARDGRTASTPDTITDEETREELARAGRYHRFMKSLLDGDKQIYWYDKDRYDKAMSVLKRVFAHQG